MSLLAIDAPLAHGEAHEQPTTRSNVAQLRPVKMSDVVEIDVASVVPGMSPRAEDYDAQHARTLAEIASLPPIVVHRPTRTIVDGVHRWEAAKIRGDRTIRAVYVDGTEDEAFVLAVRANVVHGNPLTLAEREAAARRILTSHPTWSDRLVSHICGLSATSVARQRRELWLTDATPTRIGRDGKHRPVDPAALRRHAAELLRANPQASVRSVASEVGTSQATVRDVRDRLLRGESELPPRVAAAAGERPASSALAHDAAFGDDVRAEFAEWFDGRCVDDGDWSRFVDAVPLGRVYDVVDECQRRARSWGAFAAALSDRISRRR